MKKTMIALSLSAVVLSACAQSPDAIAAVPMGNAYAGASCSSASAEVATERRNLETLSSAQRNAAVGDALGVFIIGIPISSVSGGDKAGLIAASKGKIISLEQRLRSC